MANKDIGDFKIFFILGMLCMVMLGDPYWSVDILNNMQ